jgi:hypothetical protein
LKEAFLAFEQLGLKYSNINPKKDKGRKEIGPFYGRTFYLII